MPSSVHYQSIRLFVRMLALFLIVSAAPLTAHATPTPTPKWQAQALDLDAYIELTVKAGETLDSLLVRSNINASDRVAAINALRPYYSPKKIKQDQVIRIYYHGGDFSEYHLTNLRLYISNTDFIDVRRLEAGTYHVALGAVPLTTMLVAKQAVITSSLFESAEAEGIPQDILFRMIKLLSYDVDFQRDIRKGDRFTLLFEQKQNKKGETLDSGDILYLSLELTKKTVTMYRFADRKGKAYFYNVEGKSIKKSLLTTPVDGYRISSGFGMRKHPVLGYNRMHKGMDFAAPRGTPIYAAGDGTIARIGRNGGYGNYIRINHGKGYATAYAHMRRFGRGMRSGKRVKQGSVIGYVGTTGRSTGPHLHYEVLVNGKQVNPHSIKTTPGSQLRGIRNGIFQRYLEQVDQLTRSLL